MFQKLVRYVKFQYSIPAYRPKVHLGLYMVFLVLMRVIDSIYV